MNNKLFLWVLLFSFLSLAIYSNFCYAQPKVDKPFKLKDKPIRPTEGTGLTTNIDDVPIIREFSVNPTSVLANNRITINWRVEPSISRITGIFISSPALGINLRSSDISGSYTYTIPTRVGAGRYQITLTVTNEAGKTSAPRVIELNVSRELGIRATRLWTNPEEFSDGQIVEFHVASNRNEGEGLRDVMVFIFYGGREIARLGPFMIGTGGMLYTPGHRIVATGPGWPGTYIVEIRSGDQISRSEFTTESITRHKFSR